MKEKILTCTVNGSSRGSSLEKLAIVKLSIAGFFVYKNDRLMFIRYLSE